MHKIVIASDSFKGCLSSREVAEAAASGVRRVFPDCETICMRIADGGEGTAEAIAETTECRPAAALVHDPLGRPVQARYHITKDRTAVMEMAAASGLTLLKPEERNPLLTSTYGTGEMILDAINAGCRDFIIGIGGSATNDGGTGMLEALGFTFKDKEGRRMSGLCGGRTGEIAEVCSSEAARELRECRFTIACDVTAPFCGPEGATSVYARQKGADEAMSAQLEAGMESLCNIIRDTFGTDLSAIQGAGAAGGLAGAFMACLNAKAARGIDLILDMAGFDKAIKGDGSMKGADLIITGEGKADSQTMQGKVISGIAARAKAHGIPVIAIAGMSEMGEEDIAASGLMALFPIGPKPRNKSDLEYAMRPEVAYRNIADTVAKALEALSPSLFRENL